MEHDSVEWLHNLMCTKVFCTMMYGRGVRVYKNGINYCLLFKQLLVIF